MKALTGTRKLVLMSGVLLALAAGRAFAVPPSGALEPANNYGSVTAQVTDPTPTHFTVCFTVTNTNDYYGIKGLIVYGATKPSSMSQPPRTQTTLYQAAHGYSWWDFNGAPDQNGDGLPDSFLAPHQTVGGSTFCLTYDRPVDLNTFSYGLHVVEPYTGKTFFAHANTSPPPCAHIVVEVLCGEDSPPHPIPGASVQLVSTGTGATVVSSSTDGSGQSSFGGTSIPNGGYYVLASAPDYQAGQSTTFSYDCRGSDVSVSVTLMPSPINYLSTGQLCGSVFFSDVQTYRDRAVPGVTLNQADLYSSTYVSADYSHSYLYQGTIPSFPELGSFGGPGQPQLWVIIGQPLLPETQWNNCSLSNMVAVEGGLGGSAARARSAFTVRMLFSQPFTGPGTAYDYTISGLELTPAPVSGPTWTVLSPVRLSGTSGPGPAAGVVPPGWMAETRFEYAQMPGTGSTAWVVGSFRDICGQTFGFRIEPGTPPAP